MYYAINDILFSHCLHGHTYQCLMAFLSEAYHLLGPQLLEFAFDFGERQLDRVPLRAVGHVVDPSEA